MIGGDLNLIHFNKDSAILVRSIKAGWRCRANSNHV